MFTEHSGFAKPCGGLVLNAVEQVQDAGQVFLACFADWRVHGPDGAPQRFLLPAQQLSVHAGEVGQDFGQLVRPSL